MKKGTHADKNAVVRKTRVGIKEIAAEAGVSSTTVSNVVAGKTERISEETVQRVQRLLEEKKYVPSMGNRLLSGKHSGVIGVMIGKTIQHAEAGEAALWIREVEKEIYRCGCYMLLHFAASEEEILRLAMMWKMEGIILTGFEGKMEESVRSRCAIPVISAKIGNAV
ncbi:MAG: LacI family DNA-binding transcriptional regulator, partial [Clostridiales bacterium]|nr:LacI family DNA-binding transcriptional regulator [Clostridiales bacterium]